MILGFDAKRAFHNRSGLGNYSRHILRILFRYFPENEYHLYTPYRQTELFTLPREGKISVHHPRRFDHRMFPWWWRSFALGNELIRNRPDVYHGLSNEIPTGMSGKIPSVVSIHDLIFLRFPGMYSLTDRLIYTAKLRYACRKSSMVVAASEQTRDDLVRFLQVPEKKIRVIYQGCDPVFDENLTEQERTRVLSRYELPDGFLLSVGTVEERKNLLNVVKAIHLKNIPCHLVVVGRQKAYAQKVKEYISRYGIDRVIFLDGIPSEDLAAIYRSATIFLYPSLFEGFGIPVLEALRSGVPVITSGEGCFREVGADAALYVDPRSPEDIAGKIQLLLDDPGLRQTLKEKGKIQSGKFSDELIASNWMNLYQSLM